MSHRIRRRRRSPRSAIWLLVAAVVGAVAIAGAYATSATTAADPMEKVERQLQDELAESEEATFWVYLRDRADLRGAQQVQDRTARGRFVHDRLTATAARSQAGVVALLKARGAPFQSFWIANAVKVTGDADLLAKLAARPEVEQIAADRVYSIPEPTPAEAEARIQQVEWGIARIRADEAWDQFGARGDGIVVGSIDTGVLFSHPALVAQYRGNNGDGTFDHDYNWHDPSRVCGNPSLVPCDNNGHGTHVHGTMVGDDGGDNQIGVAPEAKWIAAKGCESTNCSQTALLSSGQFILAPTDLDGQNPDPGKRPHIVNNSWGGAAGTDPWYRATVQAWIAAGIFPQFANGNTTGGAGCNSASNPGNLPESYSTGAFDVNNTIGAFSNRGPSAWGGIIKPNIAAPGVSIRSAWNNGAYNTISGTSMASPHVAGTIALMWSAAPALERDIEATRQLLDQTAIDTSNLTCGGTPANNNVFGEGRLDAFAAVEESPRGPIGTLAGTVTDAGSGDPVEGATVTVSGGVERVRTVGDDGSYSVKVPVGEYTLTAQAFGYGDATAQATVAEDETTTRNFALERLDHVTVSGTVTDGSGHGWPLYVKVRAAGTPVSTYTSPFTGEYSLSLPAGAEYSIVFDSQYPGYRSKTETVEVEGDDVTLDAELTVDFQDCRNAPGYRVDQPRMAMITSLPAQFQAYFAERGVAVDFFTVGQLAQVTGYDVVVWGYNATTVNGPAFLDFLGRMDTQGTGVVFLDHAFATWNGIKTLSQFTGQPASVSTSTAGTGMENLYEVLAEHPVLEGFQVGDKIVHEPGLTAWAAWFTGYSGDGRQVIADVGRTNNTTLGSGIGVQERANNRHVLLAIHSQSATRGPADWSADSDRIFWNAIRWVSPADRSFECVPVDGGLVVGHVTDLNTGDGVDGATVVSDANPDDRGVAAATPDDKALGDGFYWLFSSLTGPREFTASAGNYVAVTETVDVAADAATEASFALAAGRLAVSAAEVRATLVLGQKATRTFTIENTGTAPATVELREQAGSFELLDGVEAKPVPAEGTYRPAAGLKLDAELNPDARTTRGQLLAGTRPSWAPAAPGAIIRSWVPTGMGLAWGVGYDGKVWLSDVPDNDRNHEFTTAGTATGRSHHASWVGTWPGDMAPYADHLCQVNVGGDNGIYCWNTSTGAVVDRIVGTFPWTSISQRGLAYRADDDTFYIGGWNQNVLYQVRGLGHATPGQVVHQCSFPGMGISGLAWNPTAEILWVATNSATDTIFQVDPQACQVLGALAHPRPGFNGGGLAMDEQGNLWLLEQRNEGGENRVYLMESGVPHVVDVDWLGVSPATATLAPGDRITVTVTMDGAVDQPGTYTAAVGIGHDTPYALDPVGVAMVVTPPNNWAKVTGVVSAVDCEGRTAPLAGALVQVYGRHREVTLLTGEDGAYAYWANVNNDPLTLIVAHGWAYKPQTRQARLQAQRTTTADFVLRAIC